jgi:hypothetical protein
MDPSSWDMNTAAVVFDRATHLYRSSVPADGLVAGWPPS